MGFGIKNMNRSESTEAATTLRSSERIMLVPNFERDILFVIPRITAALLPLLQFERSVHALDKK